MLSNQPTNKSLHGQDVWLTSWVEYLAHQKNKPIWFVTCARYLTDFMGKLSCSQCEQDICLISGQDTRFTTWVSGFCIQYFPAVQQTWCSIMILSNHHQCDHQDFPYNCSPSCAWSFFKFTTVALPHFSKYSKRNFKQHLDWTPTKDVQRPD